jgi:hypothetical protein
MIIKVANLIVELKSCYQTFFSEQINQFQTNETPEYSISSSLVTHIEIPPFNPITSSQNIVNFQTNEGFTSLGYIDNLLSYQVILDQKKKRYQIDILKDISQPKDELEFVVMNRIFSSIAITHQLLTFHASAINVKGEALLFAGQSGVGKTTLSKKWIKNQEGSYFINDDKPLISANESHAVVYGSPFAGQEALNSNTQSKIKAIFFLEQAHDNEIVQLSKTEKIIRMMEHIQRFISKDNILAATTIVGNIIDTTPIYLYKLKDDEEAYEYLYKMLDQG